MRFSRILWAVMAIVLCAAPCVRADVTIPAGEPCDIDYPVSGSLWVYGIVNLLPGADIEWFVYATDTSVLNIKGGTVGWWIDVAPGATVTVYGTDFKVNGEPVSEGSMSINGTLTVLYENATDPVSLGFDCHPGATVTLAAPAIAVNIDIKPGSDPNPINPGSNGLIPVAILTTLDFDAADVDPTTVTLAGVEVAVRGKAEKLMARLEDVDGDGDDDLLLQVETQSEGTLWESGPVTLTGKTYDGDDIKGTDEVIIVPPVK